MAIILAAKIVTVFLVFGVVAQAEQQINATIGTEEYIIQNQKQYDAVIAGFDRDIATFQLNYEQRVATIGAQNDLLVVKLKQTNIYLDPLEVFDDKSKFCVRKYRYPISNIAYYQNSIATCASSSIVYSKTLTQPLENLKNNLNSYYKTNLNAFLNDCTKKFSKDTANYTLCVTQAISTTNANTYSYQKSFETQLEQSQCSADSGIKKALDCSFNIMYNSIAANGKAVALIEKCIAELSECKPCKAAENSEESCANVVNVQMKDSDFRNATIVNPFYGLDKSASCILFSFNKPLALR